MRKLKGAFLDSALKKIALDMIAVQGTGLAVDVNATLQNLNERHQLVPAEELEKLKNDVNLSIAFERGRRLKSMSTIGYGSYRAEPYVEKTVEAVKRLGSLLDALPSTHRS